MFIRGLLSYIALVFGQIKIYSWYFALHSKNFIITSAWFWCSRYCYPKRSTNPYSNCVITFVIKWCLLIWKSRSNGSEKGSWRCLTLILNFLSDFNITNTRSHYSYVHFRDEQCIVMLHNYCAKDVSSYWECLVT